MSDSTYNALVEEARKWLFVREATGHNDGKEVSMFQKAVDGKAQGESWCMAFVQYCLQQVETVLNVRTNVYSSEHCLTVWAKSPAELRRPSPGIGFIVIWQHGDTSQGHTGIVTSFDDEARTFTTIEGNTGAGRGVVREGDGVYERVRHYGSTGDMRVVGFLDPFAAPEVLQ